MTSIMISNINPETPLKTLDVRTLTHLGPLFRPIEFFFLFFSFSFLFFWAQKGDSLNVFPPLSLSPPPREKENQEAFVGGREFDRKGEGGG